MIMSKKESAKTIMDLGEFGLIMGTMKL